MEQEKIWDYFQNEGLESGTFPEARQRYLLSKLKPGQRVLNIGIGSGSLERMAAARSIDIHALDPSERAIARLRNELSLGDKAVAGYAQSMPFPDKHFDLVVMSEVLEHLDDEVLAASLREVRRVLRPGGHLFATTPFREGLADNTVVCPNCATVFHKYGHLQSFDRARMRTLLEAGRLDVAKLYVTTFVDWRKPGPRALIKSSLRFLLARMGETIADPHLVVWGERLGE